MNTGNSPSNDNGLTEDAAEAALLQSLMGGPEGSEGGDGDDGGSEEDDEGGEYEEHEPHPDDLEEGEEEEGDGGDESQKAPESAQPLADDHVLNLDIGGTLSNVTVADIKALYGQREALGRKDKEVDAVGARAAQALQTAVEVIAGDLRPYANVDWLVLQQQLDPDTFAWHRNNAAGLEEKYRKLTGAVQGVEQAYAQRKKAGDAEAMAQAMAEMKAEVPGWDDKALAEVLKYGADQGLDPDDLAQLTNPKVFKIMRKAMLQDRAASVTARKVKAAPAKVIAGSKAASPTSNKAISASKAMQRLAKTGSEDAAVAALLARMR